ncbi:hypothetical protein Tco_0331801 [Tanacetum coccineum]
MTKAQKRNQQSNYLKNIAGYTLQQFRGYSFDKIKTLFETTMRKLNTFVPIESEVDRAIPELAVGSSKRGTEEELDQESSKRQKTDESSELAEEPKDKEADELSQEELQYMMIVVLEQGMNVEALQIKYPIINWEIYTEGTRKYWKIIRVGNHTEVHHFFDDMLKSFDRDDLVMLWSLVNEKFNSTEPTDDKEREIWIELKRLFEPYIDDEEGNRHLHTGREGVSIVKGNSYIDVGRKALAKESILSWDQQFEFTHAHFSPLLYVNVMSKKFHNSIMKDKMVYKGNNVIGDLMNVPIFVGTFSVVMDFAVLENMDAYRDEGMGDVIFGEPFLREVGIKARRFKGMITIYNGNDEVTYQIVRSHPRFKNHTNEQCNKILPLLKVSDEDKKNVISHPYQKLKGFYKGVLNLGPDYI